MLFRADVASGEGLAWTAMAVGDGGTADVAGAAQATTNIVSATQRSIALCLTLRERFNYGILEVVLDGVESRRR